MSSFDIVYQVPDTVKMGLATGVLQRIGGAIQYSSSYSSTRQVVAFLRDETTTKSALSLAGQLPSPLNGILTLARTAATLYDGRQTRKAVYNVGQNVREVRNLIEIVSHQVNDVNQQVRLVLTLGKFTSTGMILNLALAAASFSETMQRLDMLSQEVAKLGEIVRAEFARDRDIRFKKALQNARDVFEIRNDQTAVRLAIDGLYEAREHFLADFQEALRNEHSLDALQKAQHYLTRAMYAEISRIRCYLASGDTELAKKRFEEDLPHLRDCSRILVDAWLDNRAAVFFHAEVESENLDRFVQVRKWLDFPDTWFDVDAAGFLFSLIDELRHDFWNPAAKEPSEGRLRKVLPGRRSGGQIELTDRLEQSEIIIENYQRLIGFELELHAMNQPLDEWCGLVKEQDINQHGLALLVDTDAMGQLNDIFREE